MNASRIVKQSFVILALAAFLLAGGLPNQARAQTLGQMLENTRTEHTRPPASRSDSKPPRQSKPREKETSWHWREYESDEEEDTLSERNQRTQEYEEKQEVLARVISELENRNADLEEQLNISKAEQRIKKPKR